VRAFIPFKSDREIIAIGNGLRDKTLPKPEWTHAAHFAAALWVLAHHAFDDAVTHMRTFICSYNEHCGHANTDTSGYHETITQASMRAAYAFSAQRAGSPLFDVCNELLRSPFGDPHWVLTYWSKERLFSVAARRTWLEPDIRALPF
jgi:hypothetical protein